MKTQNKSTDKIHIITLGCSKNTVDSEKLISQLSANNLKIEHNVEKTTARNIIINTCGFISDAKQESIDTILQYANAKQAGKIDNLFVIGCLAERYAKDLKEEIPEVNQFFGANDIQKIVKGLGYNYRENLIGERAVSTPSHYAYLKISEGCDRGCSYCAIPLMRGLHKSVPMELLIEEATLLANKGVKELILIAQDLSYYGKDLYGKLELARLVQKLSEIKGIEWIRLHYAYPAGFPHDVLAVIQNNPKVCNYLDMPFQHISDNMLKKMRRAITKDKTMELIAAFRKEVPGITLRTTLLVGHPGETDEDFDELLDFVRQTRFDRLGVFPYSPEEDTYAFKKYADDVPDEVKMQRADAIMQLQQQISEEINQNKVGKEFKTIIDRKEGDFYIGRTEADSPEVDNEVLIESKDVNLKIGTFYTVKITKAREFDIFGEVI